MASIPNRCASAAPFIAEELGVKLAPILDRFFHRRWSGRPSVPRPSARWRIASAARQAADCRGAADRWFHEFLTVFCRFRSMLMAVRVLAAELGGATPCFIALTSEYTPARLRAAWSAFPLGGLLGGLDLNWYLIPHAGWRAIFYIGGVAPLVLAVALFSYLPKVDGVPSRPAQR